MANDVQLQIQAEQEAQATVISYADWLVTTLNDALPQNNWTVPSPHPSTIPIENVRNLDRDYKALVNLVERYTKFTTAYCIKIKPGKQPTCRFHFPKDFQDETSIDFKLFRPTTSQDRELTVEEISQARVKATLTTKRNDKRINSHNHVMLQHWRANADLQVIVDTSTLTSVSGTWQSMQQKVNLDHSQHLEFSVCVLRGAAIQTWLHVHCEEH